MRRSARTLHGGKGLDTLQAQQARRARKLLLATGWVMLGLGLGWTLFFAMQGVWLVTVIELFLSLFGLGVVVAALRHRLRMAAWLAFGSLFVFLCVFSLWLDVPVEGVQRVTHLFLLVLAACAHYVFRAEAPWLRYGVVCLFLAAFVMFAGIPRGVSTEYAISQPVRRIGIWVNLVCVAASLLLVLKLQESDSRAHHALHRALRDALASRRFELFYQPQIDAAGHVIGAEALLRWHDPKRGLVPPGEFVQAAEETGFILPLGQWVLATACEQLQAWRGHPQLGRLRLSVNVSALQLRQPEFVPQVLDALQRSGVPGELLTLELTESVLLHDMDAAVAKMQALRAASVRLSLDDFGTGYSSLSYLRRMPLSELKIDRVFVAGIHRDPQAASITRSLLQLGHDLGIDVIAEGIEQQEQYGFLREQGCSLFQGYLFGKPMELAAFERLVAEIGGRHG